MKHVIARALCVFFLVLGSIGRVGANEEPHHDKHDHGRHEENHGLEGTDPRELGITFVNPQRGRLSETFRRPAEIQFDPKRIAHLKSGLGGLVRRVHSEWGQKVRKNQILVTLESRELGEAQSQILAAKARFRLAEKTYQREQSLWQEQITPEQDYLDAVLAWENARIALRQARQSLRALGFEEPHAADLNENQEGSLTRYNLTAPFDGTIINQHVSQGERLEAQDTVVTLVDPSVVWVVARVAETDIRKLHIGMPVSLSLTAYPHREFRGTVAYLAAELDPETRTLEVRAALENKDHSLLAGMFGELSFQPLPTMHESWLLPANAVQRTTDGYQVYVADDEDHFETLAVQVTARHGDQVAVQGSLKANHRIAAGDLFLLKSMAEKSAMGGHSH